MNTPETINGWTMITDQRPTAWGRGNKCWVLFLLDDEGITSACHTFDVKRDMVAFAQANPVNVPGPRTVVGSKREAALRTQELYRLYDEEIASRPRRSRRQKRNRGIKD